MNYGIFSPHLPQAAQLSSSSFTNARRPQTTGPIPFSGISALASRSIFPNTRLRQVFALIVSGTKDSTVRAIKHGCSCSIAAHLRAFCANDIRPGNSVSPACKCWPMKHADITKKVCVTKRTAHRSATHSLNKISSSAIAPAMAGVPGDSAPQHNVTGDIHFLSRA